MGVDVYLSWEKMSEEDKQKRITGFDVTCGKYGYLRGAFNGHIGLEAIKQFFGKYYNDSDGEKIDFDFEYIEKNLSNMEKGLFKHQVKKFHPKEQQSYRDFLKLAKEKRDKGLKVQVAIR